MNKVSLLFILPLILASVSVSVADVPNDLGQILKETGWDRLIGTWVDAETQGKNSKVSYTWRFKDKLIEITTEEQNKESVSMMGRNPKHGEVFHASADNQGGSNLGRWTFTKEKAVLEFMFITGDTQEGSLRIIHELADDNTMMITLDLPEPVEIKMIRLETESKQQ